MSAEPRTKSPYTIRIGLPTVPFVDVFFSYEEPASNHESAAGNFGWLPAARVRGTSPCFIPTLPEKQLPHAAFRPHHVDDV